MAQDTSSHAELIAKMYHEVTIDAAKDIRLLDLLPGSRDSELQGTLRVSNLPETARERFKFDNTFNDSLEELPHPSGNSDQVSGCEVAKYEALSYVWGYSTKGRTIRINQHYVLPITDNLFDALRRLRYNYAIRTLWVDALCIQQSNIPERSQQVARMGDVYHGAEMANVWLGESSRATNRHLMGLMPRTAYLPRSSLRAGLLSPLIWWIDGKKSDLVWMFERPFTSKRTEAHHGDEKSRWQNRAWIIQEYALARKIAICLGAARVEVAGYGSQVPADLDKFAHRLGLPTDYVRSLDSRLSALLGLRRRRPLYEAVKILQGTFATDPRDFVYALLGLIDQSEAMYIGVDYNMTYEEVCAKSTYAAIGEHPAMPNTASHSARSARLNMLGRVCFSSIGPSLLPSWAVDFRNMCEFSPLDDWDLDPPSLIVSLEDSYRHLCLFAQEVDTICSLATLPDTWEQASYVIKDAMPADSSDLLKEGIQRLREAEAEMPGKSAGLLSMLEILDEARNQLEDPPTIPVAQQKSLQEKLLKKMMKLDSSYHTDPDGFGSPFSFQRDLSPFNACHSDLVDRSFAFYNYARHASGHALLFTTRTGLRGIAPATLEAGDIVLGFDLYSHSFKPEDSGARTMMIVRPCGQHFLFRGLTLVHLPKHRISEDFPKEGAYTLC